MEPSITFLGPAGTTFSHDAYVKLASMYRAPTILPDLSNCSPASNNGEILSKIIDHGGYGAVAMETVAEGRVDQTLESFIDLLSKFPKTTSSPIGILGAVKLGLTFCLMGRPGITTNKAHGIISHPKSLGACANRIKKTGLATATANSNGEAARLVAHSQEYANFLAIGPRSAAQSYNLEVIESGFEDSLAHTTFFLIGPRQDRVHIGNLIRCLIVFEIPHVPGGLLKTLEILAGHNLNMIQIHSMHVGNRTYHFAVETEGHLNTLGATNQALKEIAESTPKCLTFGPFQVKEA